MHSVEFKLQKMFVYPFLVTNCQITTLLKAERMLTKVTVVARFKLKSRNLSYDFRIDSSLLPSATVKSLSRDTKSFQHY